MDPLTSPWSSILLFRVIFWTVRLSFGSSFNLKPHRICGHFSHILIKLPYHEEKPIVYDLSRPYKNENSSWSSETTCFSEIASTSKTQCSKITKELKSIDFALFIYSKFIYSVCSISGIFQIWWVTTVFFPNMNKSRNQCYLLSEFF